MIEAQYLQHQRQQQQDILNSVEFTDLTAPVHEDRRRRKSTTLQDKQAISNMRIVRHTHLHPPNRNTKKRQKEKLEKKDEQKLTTKSPPTAPPSPKPRLPTRLPRTQRKTRPTPRIRARNPRSQTPRPRKIPLQPRRNKRQAPARSRVPADGDQRLESARVAVARSAAE